MQRRVTRTLPSAERLARPADGRHVLSRFVSLSWRDGRGVLFSPRTRAEVDFTDRRFLSLLQRFATPRRFEDATSRPDERRLLAALAEAEILVRVGDDGEPVESQPLSLWEPHDLRFHVRSRLGRGKTWRFLGEVERLPALKPAGRGARISSPAPEPPVEPFWSVLRRRRSCRRFSDQPLPLPALASLLHHAARNIEVIPNPFEADGCRRPYPGVAHAVEIYVVVPPRACKGLRAGTYHYRPGDDVLERVAGPSEASRRIVGMAEACASIRGRGRVLLCMSTRFPRIAWKYEGVAYAVALKELGCLYQAIYLTGTALGLGVCALGLGPFDALPQLSGASWLDEPPIGEMVVGVPEDA